MKKIYYSWRQIEGAVIDIARQLQKDQWFPDYIVGITRDIVLTQKQLIDIVVKLKRAKPKDALVNGVFQKTNFGLFSLN